MHIDWEQPYNFIKYDLTKVSVFSYEVNRKGKLKKDSLLLRSYEYSKDKSIIKGINHNWFYMNHSGGSHRSFYNFQNEYINNTLIHKKIQFNFPDGTSIKKNEIENKYQIEEYQYEKLNKLLNVIKYSKTENYYLHKNDTTEIFISKDSPKITEYEYDSLGRKIKEFIKIDSTMYLSKLDMKSDFNISKGCNYCPEKYLNQEWIYDKENLKEEILYSSKNTIQSKKIFFYDELNRLKTIIDSTNYFSGNPILYSSTSYKYFSNGYKEKTTINYSNSFENNIIEEYDEFHRIISRKKVILDFETNEKQYFEYEDDKITKTTTTDNCSDVFKTIWIFNQKGLLIKEKWFLNNLLTGIEKYYYE